MSEHYNRAGEPISFWDWVHLFEDRRYQVVRQTKVGEVEVSTIWLGIDHGFGMSERPVIFETIVFGVEEEEQYRYPSEEDALAHHDQLVAQLRVLEGALSADVDRARPA